VKSSKNGRTIVRLQRDEAPAGAKPAVQPPRPQPVVKPIEKPAAPAPAPAPATTPAKVRNCPIEEWDPYQEKCKPKASH
jgi:hypothetical protein